MLSAFSSSVGSDTTALSFPFSKPGTRLEAQENRKTGNNKTKKPLNILNKNAFYQKI